MRGVHGRMVFKASLTDKFQRWRGHRGLLHKAVNRHLGSRASGSLGDFVQTVKPTPGFARLEFMRQAGNPNLMNLAGGSRPKSHRRPVVLFVARHWMIPRSTAKDEITSRFSDSTHER